METVALKAELRRELGKGATGRLRRNGYLPGVIYGPGVGNLPIKIQLSEIKPFMQNLKGQHLITLDVDGKSYVTLLRDIQKIFGNAAPAHLDFEEIVQEQPLKIEVELELTGVAPGLAAGGVLQHGRRSVEVECLPGDIPEVLLLDLSSLDAAHSLAATDLTLPRGVRLVTDPSTVLVSIIAPREVELEKEIPTAGDEGGGH